MKRGLITWDKTELPPSAFDERLALVRQHLSDVGLPALVVYTDVWRSNQGRYLANFMPYWNRALIAIPQDGAPTLLCALSPRVYPWIRSVTILDEIRPSQNLAQALTKMCEEKGWPQIGVLDLPLLPFDLNVPNSVNVPWSAVHPQPDEAELNMYRTAARMAREALAEEVLDGRVDHEVVGDLELKLRRAGAEDIVILVTNGDTAPLPPKGLVLGSDSSISVAMEYRGHWVKVVHTAKRFTSNSSMLRVELLSGPYPYECCQLSNLTPGSVFALTTETLIDGKRIFAGDTHYGKERL
jgi:hypothetical protein